MVTGRWLDIGNVRRDWNRRVPGGMTHLRGRAYLRCDVSMILTTEQADHMPGDVDRNVVDTGVPLPHQAMFVELPVFVAVRAEPLAVDAV